MKRNKTLTQWMNSGSSRCARRMGLVLAGCLWMSAWAGAAPSRAVIPFQGAVAVKPGQPPLDTSPYGAKFQIFTAAQGGVMLFEDIQSVAIRNGVFQVELGGAGSPLNPQIFKDNQDLWLQIALDLNRSGTYTADEELQPRTHLGATPLALYASLAGRADNAGYADQAGFAANASAAASAQAAQTAISAQSAQTAVTAQSAQTAGHAETAGYADTAGAASSIGPNLRIPIDLRNKNNTILGRINSDGAFLSNTDLAATADPDRGSVYRNNVCIAWGLITSDGDLLDGFGIRDVSFNNDDFSYNIDLFNDVATQNGEPEYAVAVTSLGNIDQTEVANYEARSSTRIGVFIFAMDLVLVTSDNELDIPRVRSAFSIQVFGRQNR